MEGLTPELQNIAKEKHQFRNWANTYGSYPELYFEPSTEDEISEVCRLNADSAPHAKMFC
jgi:hypothetical protein